MGVARFNNIHIRKEVDIETDANQPNKVAIHSSDWENANSQAGFGIMANGDAYFNNGKFRGEINATKGSFTGEINATVGKLKNTVIENSLFTGSIDSGPLYASSVEAVPQGKNFPVGSSGYEVYYYLNSRYGTNPNVSGTIRQNGVSYPFSRLRLYGGDTVGMAGIVPYDYNGSEIGGNFYVKNYSGWTAINFEITIGSTGANKTLKFKDLPTVEPSERNMVWVDANGFVRVKL